MSLKAIFVPKKHRSHVKMLSFGYESDGKKQNSGCQFGLNGKVSD